MMEKEVDLIENKEEIDKIINDSIKNKKLIFSDYYYLGIDRRGISHKRVIKIFPQFDKVIAIEIETLKKGDIGYELFYMLSNNTTFSIATIPKNTSLLIIHAVEYKRNLEKRLRKSKQ